MRTPYLLAALGFFVQCLGLSVVVSADEAERMLLPDEPETVVEPEIDRSTHVGCDPHLGCEEEHSGWFGGHLDHFEYSDRVDGHAPAGLMGDHVHEQGEIMIEYKFMQMFMDDNRAGSQRVSDQAALDVTGINFAATPTRMSMYMHMFHFMYGLSDRVTAYAMPMYVELQMDHIRRNPLMGDPDFTTKNGGMGDTVFGALVLLHQGDVDQLILNLSFSVPTGSIARRTSAPSNGLMPPIEFPYPMRLGSGTFDARPGLTYKRYYDRGSVGAQFTGQLPIGENYDGYSVGDQYALNFWTTRVLDAEENWAASFRMENLWRNNFDGFDNDLGPNNMVISTARPDMRGGYFLNLGYGAMYHLPRGGRFNFEITHPIYQDLEGVQLETDYSIFASYSKAW